ncbi:hypothetical protein MNB_SV-14-971 [hydrothermal vent metagenome]|uniref:SCP2 domain-containing protein n=1 Tax=hydrothermal vent metagenome TaxID=652676 RepID=A0A1W1CH56_9ZZZZ
MGELFSEDWINLLKDLWNASEDISGKLAEINFCSTITCGFKNEEFPKCIFIVQNGIAISAGLYQGEKSDWDMRAKKDSWNKWSKKSLGMTGMSIAVATGQLQFKKGDFKTMFKNPSMTGPFIKSFALMTQI